MTAPRTSREAPAAQPSRAALADVLLLAALTAVLSARPLISESYMRALPAFLSALEIRSGPTPLATIWLDGLLLILTVAAWAIRPPRRIGLAGAGIGLLAIAVIVSCDVASEKRIAITAASNLLITVTAGTCLATLIRRTGLARLVLCVVIAVACVNATKCLQQRSYEFADTMEAWQKQKQELAAQGYDLTAPNIIDYERRLKSAETFGYLSHPNVTAACLGLALIPAFAALLGCLLARPVKPAPVLVSAMIITALSVALVLTGSLAGWIASAGGCALVLAYGVLRPRIKLSARSIFALACGGYLALIAGIAAYGLARGTLPGASLAFRWQYWKAARQVVADAPWTGAGCENFINGYLRHKDPVAVEEIRNPHDVWLSLLAELGPLGLLAGILLAAAALWRSALSLTNQASGPAPPWRDWIWGAAAVLVLLPIVQAVFSGTPFEVAGVKTLWVTELVAVLYATFVFAASATSDARHAPHVRAVVLAGVVAALLANLVHNLVGFSIFTAAGLAMLVAVAACGAAWRGAPPDDAPISWRRRTIAGSIGLLALGAFATLSLIPATAGQWRLKRAQAATSVVQLIDRAEAATWADPLDSSIPSVLARTLTPIAVNAARDEAQRLNAIDAAERLARVALDRDPDSSSAYRLLARVLEERANILADSPDVNRVAHVLREAAANWEQAIQRNPSEVRDRIEAAELSRRLWALQGRKADADVARRHLAVALKIDSQRPPGQAAKLSAAELKRIDEIQAELERPD